LRPQSLRERPDPRKEKTGPTETTLHRDGREPGFRKNFKLAEHIARD
jgi:hypothetical protein